MQDVSKQSVSLYPEDREIINRANRQKGLKNFSAALRLILHEWQEIQDLKAKTGITEKGKTK